MAIYKNISSKVIIGKIMRDLKPNNMSNWVDDAIEWIGEALEHIGASPQLETKNCVLTLKDYKTLLPDGFYYQNQVSVNKFATEGMQTELAAIKAKQKELQDNLADIGNLDKYNMATLRDINTRLVVLVNMYFKDPDHLQPLKYGTGTFYKSEDCTDCGPYMPDQSWYIIENGYLKTSFPTGDVCLSYTAFPLDEECYPMVPDDVSYREAMFWYVFKQMLLGGFTKPNLAMDYNFADEKWKFYCTQARNAANYPDIDRYESFMNQWTKLIPNINHNSSNFEKLGKRENLYRGN